MFIILMMAVGDKIDILREQEAASFWVKHSTLFVVQLYDYIYVKYSMSSYAKSIGI